MTKQKEAELLPSQLGTVYLCLHIKRRDSVDSLKEALWNECFKQQRYLDHFSIQVI